MNTATQRQALHLPSVESKLLQKRSWVDIYPEKTIYTEPDTMKTKPDFISEDLKKEQSFELELGRLCSVAT